MRNQSAALVLIFALPLLLFQMRGVWASGGVSVGRPEPFCPVVNPQPGTGLYEVDFVQSPLMSSQTMKFLNAYHTALVFVGGQGTFTLEFRALDFLHGILPRFDPSIRMTRSSLDWNAGVVGFCLTTGVLHGWAHWTVKRRVALVTAEQFIQLLMVLTPWRFTNKYSYQMFRLQTAAATLQDLTCGQGILAVIDYFNNSLGVSLEGITKAGDLPVTTVSLLVESFEIANDADDAEIMKFYRDAEAVGAESLAQQIERVFAGTQDTKFLRVSTSEAETYYKMSLSFPYLYITHAPREDWQGALPPLSADADATFLLSSMTAPPPTSESHAIVFYLKVVVALLLACMVCIVCAGCACKSRSKRQGAFTYQAEEALSPVSEAQSPASDACE